MSENGKHSKSLPGEIFGLLEDQLELVSLEWQYEKKQGARRIAALVAAGVLAMAAFVLLQVALVLVIAATGLNVVYACLILAGVYGGLAALLLGMVARRPRNAGLPFEGTREELKKNLKWIHQILS